MKGVHQRSAPCQSRSPLRARAVRFSRAAKQAASVQVGWASYPWRARGRGPCRERAGALEGFQRCLHLLRLGISDLLVD
jgi:hypothetical protein